MAERTSHRRTWAVVLSATIIGVVSFLIFDSRCQPRKWHAPATIAEMKVLIREAMALRAAPNDLSRLASLDQFAEVVSTLPQWRGRNGVEAAQPKYSPAEVQAFLDDLASYYNDEWAKPAETYFYHLFWHRCDFASPDWSNNFLARTNPTVSKFVMGLGIDVQTDGPYPFQQLANQELFHAWWSFEPFLLAAQDRASLVAARRVSAAFGAGSLVLIFLIGCRLGGRVGVAAGLVASLLLYDSPIFQSYATRATVDVMLVFFLLAGGWATTYFVSVAAPASHRALISARQLCVATLALGVSLGTAFGVKLNGSLIGVGAAAGCLLAFGLQLIRRQRVPAENERVGSREVVRAGIALAAAGMLTFAIFFASNPYYYHEPLKRFRQTLEEMDRELAHCQQVLGPAIESRSEAVKAVFYYGAMLTGEFGDRMLTPTRVAPFTPMDREAVVAPFRFCFRAVFVLLGLFMGLYSLVRIAVREGGLQLGVSCAVLGWSLTLIIGSVLWLPLRWDRYMLVPVAPAILLVSYGWCVPIGCCVEWVKRNIIEIPAPSGTKNAPTEA